MAQAFKNLGIGHVKVVGDMPLIETTLYFTPERPNELLALGRDTAYDSVGDTIIIGGLREHWISFDENVPVDFGEMPPPNEVERIQRDRRDAWLATWRNRPK